MPLPRTILTLFLAPLLALGEEAPPTPAPPPLKPVKEADGTLKLGEVSFEPETRTIRFPAWVNMTEGLIEFPVVHRNGRLHEAIFATDALPLHLEAVFRLLRIPSSQEVFGTYPGVDFDDPPPYDQWPDPVFPKANPASHCQVFATWKDKAGIEKTIDVRRMLYRIPMNAAGEEEPEERFHEFASHWVYTGSKEKMGERVEELGGSMVAVRPEPESSLNTIHDEAVHVGHWFADQKVIPAVDTPVTITIKPVQER